MNFGRKLTGMLKVLLLLIFTGYIGVLSLCTHVHMVDGVPVVHAHPFKKAAQGQPFHTHTQTALQLIQVVTDLQTTAYAVPHFLFEPFLPELFTLMIRPLVQDNGCTRLGISQLRAPPIFA